MRYALILLMCCTTFLSAQEFTPLYHNGFGGTEFYLVLPLNDCSTCPTTNRAIYVNSLQNGTITYELTSRGYKRNFQISENIVLTLDQNNVPIPELPSSGASEDVIRITSTVPVWVNVYNGKQVSTDGYTALPTSSWGKDYFHCSSYDFNEVRPWKSGFVVVASENNTHVVLSLRTTAVNPAGGTEDGMKLTSAPTLKTITLQQGQAYLVQGNGTTRGQFDVTGSRITADKPISVISFNQRTMLPTGNNPGGRDHIVEAMHPVQTWGKEYTSIEILRGGKGDLFRAVSQDSNTIVDAVSYNFKDRTVDTTYHWVLAKAGDMMEFNNPPDITNTTRAVKGVTYWKSNKPFMLMHYNYSTAWDNIGNNDPFMMNEAPVEQWINSAVVVAPDNPVYKEHYMNLVALGDTTDPNNTLLRSVKFDGKDVWNISPSFLGNRIPGTNYWYARLLISNGKHLLTSATKCATNLYSNGAFDSYGWIGTQALDVLQTNDVTPPKFSKKVSTNTVTYTISETSPNDVGISAVLLNSSANHILQVASTSPPNVQLGQADKVDSAICTVMLLKDVTTPVVVLIRDRAGNYVLDTITIQSSYPKQPKLLSKDTVVRCLNIIRLRWNSSQSKSYEVHVSNDAAFKQLVLQSITADTTQLYSFAPLGNSEVFWRVRGLDSSGQSIWSDTGIIKVEKLRIITVLKPENADTIKTLPVTLSWIADSVASEYQVWIQGDSSFSKKDTALTTTYVLRSLPANGYYTWQVRPVCNGLTTEWSSPRFFVINKPVSVPIAVQDDNIFSVSPQPVSNLATILVTSPSEQPIELFLYNIRGELVNNLYHGTTMIGRNIIRTNTTEYPDGAYMLILQLGNKRYSCRMVINK